jgi:CDP-diacylglycerol---serine O-phosphatidyltransferase
VEGEPPPGEDAPQGEPQEERAGERQLPFLQLVPNLMTILGLCAGLTALRFAFEERFEQAAALVILAALIDAFDGLIARKLNAASPFGAELDSLADFFNFGVVPAFLVYRMALASSADMLFTAALVFAVCCCLRLARFNVNRDLPLTVRAHFVGVPAPAGALLGMLPAFLNFAGILDASDLPWLWAGWLAAVGLLMISRMRTPALKGLRVSRGQARWLLVGAALFAGLTFSRFWLLMVLIDLLYISTLIFALVAARRSGRTATPGSS